MSRPTYGRRLSAMALVALATLLALVGPSGADGTGRYATGNNPSAVPGSRGIDNARRDSDWRHGHDNGPHHLHHRRLYYAPFAYWGYPYYIYRAPVYWYYCPSYEDYYPNVDSCPEAWVAIPAS